MSHGENVPSDHYCSRYRHRCELCGATYHDEDGGCDCRERYADEDRQAEAVLARLPSDLAAMVRRMIEEVGE